MNQLIDDTARQLFGIDSRQTCRRLEAMLEAHEVYDEYAPSAPMRFCLLVGAPVPKERPRVVPGHTYTPKKTADAEETLAVMLKRAAHGQTVEGSVAVAMIFYMPTRRGLDGDNLVKLVLDAGNKAGIWKDDHYARRVFYTVEYDPARPRTCVAWCGYASSMDPAPKKRASKELL